MNQKNSSPLTKQFQLISQNENAAQFYLLKDYDKEELVKLAIDLKQKLAISLKENNLLQGQLHDLMQQQPMNNNNQENLLIQELEQKCNDANKRYLDLYQQFEDLLRRNQEFQAMKISIDKKTNNLITTLKQQRFEDQQQLIQCRIEMNQVQGELNLKFPVNQQYQKQFNNFEKSVKDASVQCNNTIKETQNFINKTQQDQDDDARQGNSSQFQEILVKIKKAKQLIEQVNQALVDFRQRKNNLDIETNIIFENNLRTLQLNSLIMTQFEKMLIELYKDIGILQKKSKSLQLENNNLKEKMKDMDQTIKEQMKIQQPIVESIKQTQILQNLNNTQRKGVNVNFNKLKEFLTFSNDQFYQILLLFVSQGLTITDLQLKLQNQNQVVDIVIKYKNQLQQSIPKNFQELCEILKNFRQFFNELKEYITDKNKLINVFQIQDNFFENYEKVMKKLLDLETIQNQIDKVITITRN